MKAVLLYRYFDTVLVGHGSFVGTTDHSPAFTVVILPEVFQAHEVDSSMVHKTDCVITLDRLVGEYGSARHCDTANDTLDPRVVVIMSVSETTDSFGPSVAARVFHCVSFVKNKVIPRHVQDGFTYGPVSEQRVRNDNVI